MSELTKVLPNNRLLLLKSLLGPKLRPKLIETYKLFGPGSFSFTFMPAAVKLAKMVFLGKTFQRIPMSVTLTQGQGH